MGRAKRTTPEERMDAFVRLARRLKKAGRSSPTVDDYKVVAKEYGVADGTFRGWCSRYSDAWEEAQIAAGLLPEREAPVATSGSSGQSGPEMVAAAGLIAAAGLSTQQAEACRLRTLGNMTQREVGALVNCHPDTVGVWERTLPAWRQYQQTLEQLRHQAIVDNHRATIGRGTHLRLRLLAVVDRYLEQMERKDAEPDSEDLKRVADLIDRLTTSAEDRGGYPRSEVRQVGISQESPFARLPDDELDERIQQAEARLRLIEGGKS